MVFTESPVWAEHPELVEFYSGHRNRPEDLYASERRFLPWLARQANTVLDVGCAAGGFCEIWRAYRSSIKYSGVDVSSGLIAEARKLFPDAKFYHGNCVDGLPFPDRYAEVVQALGWLHWEPRYREALQELWRVCDRFLFFDVRLAAEGEVNGLQQVTFSDSWDGATTTPYLCLAWPAFAALLTGLRPCKIFSYGYWGKPAATVMGVEQLICFATFVLEKAPHCESTNRTMVCMDMPMAWPVASTEPVTVLPATQFDHLVPAEAALAITK